ncbi:unnamed protein product [Lepidochelys olivacea]
MATVLARDTAQAMALHRRQVLLGLVCPLRRWKEQKDRPGGRLQSRSALETALQRSPPAGQAPADALTCLVRRDIMIKASMSSGKVTLFHQDPQSEVTCRVPALLYILTDTLLAFTEKRSSARDEDAEYLVLRRSRKTGTSVEWGPTEPLKSAVLPAHRPMNPCPVYEQKSQTVFLFFICVRQRISEQRQIRTGQNAARLCYVCSGDAGRTWSS